MPEPTAPQIAPVSFSDAAADLPEARPLLFAVGQEWIALLPKAGKYRHGLYGEIDLTGDRNARFVANFNDNVYGQDPPINAEHDGRASGAVGWIKGMRLAADGSIEIRPEWNDRGRALLSGDRFRYVSAEFMDRWQDPVSGEWHRDVVVGCAICTRPHFKTDVLRPIAASEAAALALFAEPAPEPTPPPPPTSEPEPEPGQSDEAGVAGEEIGMADEPTTTQAPAAEPTPATDTPATPATPANPVVQQLTEEAAREFAELRRDKLRLEAEKKELAEANARLLAESRVKRFTAEVRGASEANGKAYIGHLPDHVQMLCDLEQVFGPNSQQVRFYMEQNRAHAELAEKSVLFREMGVGKGADTTTTVEDQINALAREIAARTPGKSQAQAFTEVLNTNAELRSELARERKERTGGR